MRVWAIVLALSVVSHTVGSQPAEDPVSRLKACFQLEHALQAECLENLSRGLTDKNESKFRGAGGSKLDRERNDVACGLQSHDYRYDFFPIGRERCTCDLHDPLSRPAHRPAGQHGRIVARLASQRAAG